MTSIPDKKVARVVLGIQQAIGVSNAAYSLDSLFPHHPYKALTVAGIISRLALRLYPDLAEFDGWEPSVFRRLDPNSMYAWSVGREVAPFLQFLSDSAGKELVGKAIAEAARWVDEVSAGRQTDQSLEHLVGRSAKIFFDELISDFRHDVLPLELVGENAVNLFAKGLSIQGIDVSRPDQSDPHNWRKTVFMEAAVMTGTMHLYRLKNCGFDDIGQPEVLLHNLRPTDEIGFYFSNSTAFSRLDGAYLSPINLLLILAAGWGRKPNESLDHMLHRLDKICDDLDAQMMQALDHEGLMAS